MGKWKDESGRDIRGTFIHKGEKWKYKIWFRPSGYHSTVPYFISFLPADQEEEEQRYFWVSRNFSIEHIFKKKPITKQQKLEWLLCDRGWYLRTHEIIDSFVKSAKDD